MLPIFRGAATALLTPFRPDGSIDLPAWDRLLERQLDAGIAALVVCGTTGEAATLTQDERLTLLRRAKQAACDHCPVIMGVGTNCTAGSVENAELAAQNGADALLAVTPYYNKGTQAGLLAHYTAIADASSLPLVLYNVPSRTGVDLLPETVRALARHPHIAGIKEACGSISRAAQLLARCGLPVWSGNDDQTAAIMALGGSGVISVVSNVAPEAVVAMTDACLAGDFREGAPPAGASAAVRGAVLRREPHPGQSCHGGSRPVRRDAPPAAVTTGGAAPQPPAGSAAGVWAPLIRVSPRSTGTASCAA